MKSRPLSTILLSAPPPEALIDELAGTLDAHISGRGGLKGLAMKAGYGALKAAKPDAASRAVRVLLPDMAKALEPLHTEYCESSGRDFGAFLSARAERASALMIAVADARIGQSQNAMARTIYQKFRGSAGDELEKLLPQLGRVIEKHLS